MRAYLVALVALTTLASTGCSGLNLFRRGTESCNDPIGCTDPSCTAPSCTQPTCTAPIGCAVAVSPAGPVGMGVASAGYGPTADFAGAAPYAPAPYAPAETYASAPYAGSYGAPYQPSYTGGYGHGGHGQGGGRFGHFHGNNNGFVPQQGPPAAQVGYPYYTTRGPRDFLMNNPPSIGR
jgi:hypothetical protein